MPVCAVGSDLSFGHHECADAAAAFYFYVDRFKQHPIDWADGSVFGRPTAAVADLSRFGGFVAYEKAVSRNSHGNINRYVKKARRLGHTTRLVDLEGYRGSTARIRRSKLFRTSGLMLDALRLRTVPADDPGREPVRPACRAHWTLCWGAFKGELLTAYIVLTRNGDVVRTVEIMGDKSALSEGGVKLLVFDIVRALIDPEHDFLAGVRYLIYGAVEHGGDGLFDWKLRMEFHPRLIGIELPADFREEDYLHLNPDVRNAGVAARLHYAVNGKREGRRYR